MFSWEWSNMSSWSCAFYVKIRGGRGTDRDSREEGWSGQVFYSDCPPQPTVIWNKSLHASHWSDCQDCTNRGLSLAAACRDLQSVSVQVFHYKSSHIRPLWSRSNDGLFTSEQARSKGRKLNGKYFGFIFPLGFGIRAGIFGLGFRKFAILEATSRARQAQPNS